jgi:hypothetical protein
VVAGRGSGKTELAKRRLIRYLPIKKPWPNPRYFYGAPTRPQAKRIAWEHLKSLIPPNWISQIWEGELRITTRFGSTLYVFGLGNSERLDGDHWDGCVLDESSDLVPKLFARNVVPALTHREGWCWRIGVPKRQGVGGPEFRKFFEEGMTGNFPDRASFWWPSSTVLDANALRTAMETLDAKDYAEQFEAQWETAGGSVFHAFDSAVNARPCEYHADRPLIVGVDFNVDPMAWAIGHKHDDRMEWIDELWLRNTNTRVRLRRRYWRSTEDISHGGQ